MSVSLANRLRTEFRRQMVANSRDGEATLFGLSLAWSRGSRRRRNYAIDSVAHVAATSSRPASRRVVGVSTDSQCQGGCDVRRDGGRGSVLGMD